LFVAWVDNVGVGTVTVPLAEIDVTVSDVAVIDVNALAAGVVIPIDMLLMFPTLLEKIETVVPDKVKLEPALIATTPVALIATVPPPDIWAFPPTIKLLSVPNLVKLLLTIPLPRVELLRAVTPDIKKFDKVLTLPLESTVNPGLSNPASDLRYF